MPRKKIFIIVYDLVVTWSVTFHEYGRYVHGVDEPIIGILY